MKKLKRKRNKGIRYSIIALSICALLAWKLYSLAFSPCVFTKNNAELYDIAIPSGANIQSISNQLSKELNFTHSIDFMILAHVLKLNERLYPGLYTIQNGMSVKDLVLLFRSGKRKTVKLQIRFARYARDIIKDVEPHIEADYDEMMSLLTNAAYIDSLGFSAYTIISMFLMDTYFFNWNTSAQQFFQRMHTEYTLYWNQERLSKAQQIGLTPHEVMTLASIVDQETNKNDEKPRVAGVYMNRLRIKMPLQADPTVKYAVGDFALKRVRKVHTEKKSLYNTYKNQGLPPGPICTPTKAGIDAVLNFEQHSFLYFCAQPNYSGYHMFAKKYDEHLANARTYHRWLNAEGY